MYHGLTTETFPRLVTCCTAKGMVNGNFFTASVNYLPKKFMITENAQQKIFYNEDGASHTDTLKANRDAEFKNGGLKGWGNYLHKQVYWPEGYRFSKGNMAVVVVALTINEEGKPEDVFVVVPFHPQFDKIALRAVSSSPAWNPAMANNRKVKQRLRQPVTFQQEEE
ncbi:MAG: TonB family protein [Bacteroidia bacterium]|nr:TonB family protein [Bacteroidia bacterium]